MKITVSCDHRGTAIMDAVRRIITQAGHELVPVPYCDGASCDYPDMAYAACIEVAHGRADRGVLICGSGIGMSIAANKVKGIRAALVHDDIGAEMSRRHNDANVICLSADMLGLRLIEKCLHIWLTTDFEAGRHARRINKITAIENGGDPSSVTD
ncbi:MAG: ribose 5-phosphate isomerase B [Planctomycetes bacterium]|nr:ribose 5-phosphate isomerase B [Planctomycetota bacterium]